MTRCHDTKCGARHRCERFRQRDSGEPGTQHCMTLKLAWIPHTARCAQFVWARGIEPLLESGPAGWIVAAWMLGWVPADVHLGSLMRGES